MASYFSVGTAVLILGPIDVNPINYNPSRKINIPVSPAGYLIKISLISDIKYNRKIMNILIIGSTGKTGRELIKQGLERGHSITAMVRSPGKIKIEHPKLKIIQGNVLDPASLERSIIGQDAVLSALGHKKFFINTNILSRGTSHLIAAMHKQQLCRLICITSLGINDSRYRLGLYYTLFIIPFIIFFYFRDKARQECLIMHSDLNWTIIRPGQLTNGKRREKYRHGPGLGHYLLTRMISRANVAHFMLEELVQGRYIRKVAAITY